MKRRDFTAGLLLAAIATSALAQQPGRQYRIALVHPTIPANQLTEKGGAFYHERPVSVELTDGPSSGECIMKETTGRRTVLLSAGARAAAAAMGARPGTAAETSLLPEGAGTLRELTMRLAQAARRRDFKAVPMILDDPAQWDHEALSDVIRYRGRPRQVWDNTELGGPWLNEMRNSLNTQIWSFRHPDFLVVSATHGSAHLALFDQAMWDKYQLANMTGGKFKSNTLIEEQKAGAADAKEYEDPQGVFSPHDNSIPALQRRGVVFLACHNAIWEASEHLLAARINPDELSHEAMAAELINHLIPGVVLTPGIVGTLTELQMSGFAYAK